MHDNVGRLSSEDGLRVIDVLYAVRAPGTHTFVDGTVRPFDGDSFPGWMTLAAINAKLHLADGRTLQVFIHKPQRASHTPGRRGESASFISDGFRPGE